MAFLLQELGKGFVRALESTSAEISAWVSICKAACASTCAWYGKAEFYSHSYIPGPSRCSTTGSTQTPAVVFRCPSTQDLQLAKKPIRWAGGRIIEVMIGAVQTQLIVMEAGGDGERSRLTELSGGSGSSRLECGIRGSAVPLKEESRVVLLLKPFFGNLCIVLHKRHIENSII